MNFIFVSPNFPHTYGQFCDRLKRNGINVLGIGDAPYETLEEPLKAALTEYYKVDNMENYDSMYRAVAFLAFKHGKIDWLESNTEYWLEQDAKLRKDFNIGSGVQPEELAMWKSKSAMKPFYKEAGVPTARNHKVTTIEAAREFLDEIGGFPVHSQTGHRSRSSGYMETRERCRPRMVLQQSSTASVRDGRVRVRLHILIRRYLR